jgi:hypothetical protein
LYGGVKKHVLIGYFCERGDYICFYPGYGTFRERTKVVRSFDSELSTENFAAGMQTYYNYIRPHQGIGGLTSAEMAGIPLDLTGNRWMTMIGLAVEGK